FAYMIHTEIGNACTGARVNGRIVPLRSSIQNGDVVEIITSPNSHPSRDWLNFVVTSKARNRVRHWVAEQQRAESIDIGRKLFEREESKLRSGMQAVKRLMRLGDDAIVVRGVDDVLIARARCCNPVHGEAIVGYITRGKGVVVHARRCKNVEQLMINPERIVEVE